MGVIWKYPLGGPGVTTDLTVPRGAQVQHFGEDHSGGLHVWFHAPEPGAAASDLRTLTIVATGEPFDEGVPVATFVEPSGLVWHLLDRSEVDLGDGLTMKPSGPPAPGFLWALWRDGLGPQLDPDGHPILGTPGQLRAYYGRDL